jgi:hypothetical protein
MRSELFVAHKKLGQLPPRRCMLCLCNVRHTFFIHFWNRTILLCMPCIACLDVPSTATHRNKYKHIILLNFAYTLMTYCRETKIAIQANCKFQTVMFSYLMHINAESDTERRLWKSLLYQWSFSIYVLVEMSSVEPYILRLLWRVLYIPHTWHVLEHAPLYVKAKLQLQKFAGVLCNWS